MNCGGRNRLEPTYKIRSWRHSIDRLCEETGIGLREVCQYTGAAYNEDGVSFYVKLPRSRRVYIGIGMAFGQPVEVINEWITRYAGKRRLYVKDISEDLVWVYLIRANLALKARTGREPLRLAEEDPHFNYFLRYEEFQALAYAVFQERWDELLLSGEDTQDVDISLATAALGKEYEDLRTFVAEHMEAFKTAYVKPRSMLDRYVDRILRTCQNHPRLNSITSLNAMRGYLDDSMINFLSGSSETINVIDRTTGKRTVRIKHVPKGKQQYIRLCIALGMTTQEINSFLELMGYASLDMMNSDEGALAAALTEWDSRHPIQHAFKSCYFWNDDTIRLTQEEENLALDEMFQLRSDLSEQFPKVRKEYLFTNK